MADADILVYRLILSTRSAAVTALVNIDAQWAAPLLWRLEVRNALAGHLRAGQISVPQADTMMKLAAASLLGGEHTVSNRVVLELVAQSRASAYDCEYVALEQALSTVLVTEDRALLRSFPRHCRSIDQML